MKAPSDSPPKAEEPQSQHPLKEDADVTPGGPTEGEFYEQADPILYSLLKNFVAEHRKHPTKAEDFLWQQLRGNKLDGFAFRRQHIIGCYIADFVCLAKGLGSHGKVLTIEANREYSHLITKHIMMAGVQNNIEVVFGDALKIIPQRKEKWDLVYIDANKQEYPDYYSAVIDHVRPGGIILSDNVLWSGKVVYEPEDPDALVINQYNMMLKDDPRVDVLMLPIRDGISVARKV